MKNLANQNDFFFVVDEKYGGSLFYHNRFRHFRRETFILFDGMGRMNAKNQTENVTHTHKKQTNANTEIKDSMKFINVSPVSTASSALIE